MIYPALKIKIDWRLVVVAALGLGFFFVYSYLAFNLPASRDLEPKLIFNSPDETSNFFFAAHFSYNNSLQFADEANHLAGGLVSPRSMRVILGQTAPASFLGLPLIYGVLAKAVGIDFIPFFTPLLAVAGIFFFYLLVKQIFSQNIACLSALLAYILPAVWYFAAKSLMPNVPFVSLTVIALYFLVKLLAADKQAGRLRNLFYYLFFGFFISLALIIRTSEIVWLGPLVLALLICRLKKINFYFLLLSLLVAVMVFLPIFYFNQQIYGSPFSLGYSLNIGWQNKTVIGQGLSLLKAVFLPFGFQPRLALSNLYHYSLVIFPLGSSLVFASLICFSLWLFKHWKNHRAWLLYFFLFLLVSGYLVIYYGSWSFHDHPDPEAITIGTSYVRYWLPLYLFSLPFLSWLLINFLKKFKTVFTITAILVLAMLAFNSYKIVMLDPEEGLFQVSRNLNSYKKIAKAVINQTESRSIIIADTMDKVFFPERRVIFRLNTSSDYDRIQELIKAGWPVYYFYFTRSPEELARFNERYFLSHGLKVAPSDLSFNQQSLYPVRLNEGN